MRQADMLQADTRAAPCSQPLQQRAYATGSVTDKYLSQLCSLGT